MATHLTPRRAIGRQLPTPRRQGNTIPKSSLRLPHEQDESADQTAAKPDAVIVQAHRDLAAGMVDTDMRATPGLDAQRRAGLVPGPGGQPTQSQKGPVAPTPPASASERASGQRPGKRGRA